MKIYYYKIMTGQTLIGKVNSNSMRYWNTRRNKMHCCTEEKAQFVQYNNKFYRADILYPCPPELESKYAKIDLIIIPKKEYDAI